MGSPPDTPAPANSPAPSAPWAYPPPWAAYPPPWAYAAPPAGWTPPSTAAAVPAPAAPPDTATAPAAPLPAGAPARPASPPAPGRAPFARRAEATALDVAIGTGVVSAWQLALVVTGPQLHLVTWLAGAHFNQVIQWGYWLLTLGWWGWQWAERGRTGASLGQRLVGLRVLDVESRAPIGPGRSVARSLTHVVDTLPLCAGWLRPLWGPAGGQGAGTWADRIHRTTVVTVPR